MLTQAVLRGHHSDRPDVVDGHRCYQNGMLHTVNMECRYMFAGARGRLLPGISGALCGPVIVEKMRQKCSCTASA